MPWGVTYNMGGDVTYPKKPQDGQSAQPPAPPRLTPGGGAPGPAPQAPAAPSPQAPPAPAPPSAPPGPAAPGGQPPAAPLSNPPGNIQAGYQPGVNPQLDALIQQWQQTIDSRYDAGAWAAWSAHYDPACPPNQPFHPDPAHMKGMGVDMSAGQAQGYCVEKPVDVPAGLGPAGGGGGGGGGFLGGWGGGGGGGIPNFFEAPEAWGLTDQEKEYLAAVTGLANTMRGQADQLFGQGFPAYAQAMDFWQKLAGAGGRGGVDAVLGPAREQVAEGYEGARGQLRGLRGAERAAAESELARASAGDLARLPMELLPASVQGLQSGAEFGIGTGIAREAQAAGLYQGAQQAEAQSRLTEEGLGVQREGLGVQRELGYLQAKTSWNIASLNAQVTREGYDVQREAIAQEQWLAQQQLAQRAYEFEQNYALANRQLEQQLQIFNAQLDAQSSQRKSSLFGSIFGGIANLFTGGLSGLLFGGGGGGGGGGNNVPIYVPEFDWPEGVSP